MTDSASILGRVNKLLVNAYNQGGIGNPTAVRRLHAEVECSSGRIREILTLPGAGRRSAEKRHPMHDVVIAFVFVAMVLAPCITAARSGAAKAEENV